MRFTGKKPRWHSRTWDVHGCYDHLARPCISNSSMSLYSGELRSTIHCLVHCTLAAFAWPVWKVTFGLRRNGCYRSHIRSFLKARVGKRCRAEDAQTRCHWPVDLCSTFKNALKPCHHCAISAFVSGTCTFLHSAGNALVKMQHAR